MDKIVLKFVADVLYIKKIICVEELEAIMDAKNFSDLDDITEKMLGGEYNALKRGETYLRYAGGAGRCSEERCVGGILAK